MKLRIVETIFQFLGESPLLTSLVSKGQLISERYVKNIECKFKEVFATLCIFSKEQNPHVAREMSEIEKCSLTSNICFLCYAI